MVKKTFYILGLEGSGTYMLTNMIIEATMIAMLDDDSDIRVMRHSIPHAHLLPDIVGTYSTQDRDGYEVIPIFIIRDARSCLMSVVRRDPETKLTMRDFWERLKYLVHHMHLFGDRFECITYEAFVTSELFRRAFFDRIGLPYPQDFKVFNANEQYYSEENYD